IRFIKWSFMSVTQASNSPNGHLSELGFLDSRRSVPARQLGAPGPDHDTVLRMLQSASRVPDHGRRVPFRFVRIAGDRSEEHTSELQSLMRISYAVFCLKKKTNTSKHTLIHTASTSLTSLTSLQ